MTAAPIEPPIVRMLAFIPVAAPVWAGGTLATTMVAMEANASPMPRPNTPATRAICHCASCHSVRKPRARAPSPEPVTRRALEPKRGARRALSMPETNIARSIGSIRSPDAVTLAPKPYPALAGVWTKPGRKDQIAYMPAPNRRAARLVVHTAGSRMILRSMRGLAARDSAYSQAAARTAARPRSPRTRAEPQPQVPAWLSGSRSATSHPDRSTAPSQLTFPDALLGDSGT
nr:hypothetical protein [Streptomyces sp. ST1015]